MAGRGARAGGNAVRNREVEVGHVLPERSPERNVEQLDATADAEQRQADGQSGAAQDDLGLVTAGVETVDGGVRGLSVVGRVDVRATDEHQAIETPEVRRRIDGGDRTQADSNGAGAPKPIQILALHGLGRSRPPGDPSGRQPWGDNSDQRRSGQGPENIEHLPFDRVDRPGNGAELAPLPCAVMTRSATWITRLDSGVSGIRVAVKDLLDVEGVPTTAGCRAVADQAPPAMADAACLAGLRYAVGSGGARLVGKANLHELADGISGINPWFGTPVNPLDPDRVPGGSSSGSAVAVGSGEAEVAVGTDTGGSVRIPAACCGISGLKTTFGRVPTQGLWPLAPSLDTIGPLAADVAGLEEGMRLLEPGFVPVPALEGPVGRLRATAADGSPLKAKPEIEAALDAALALAGLEVVDLPLPGWIEAARAALHMIGAEAAEANRALVRDHADGVSGEVRAALARGARVGHQQVLSASAFSKRWALRLEQEVFGRVAAVALPVLDDLPPRLDGDLHTSLTVRWTAPVNLAGLPALALPVPLLPNGLRDMDRKTRPRLPTSLQLVGPAGSEAGLLGLGARIEAAIRTG
jgi:amidase